MSDHRPFILAFNGSPHKEGTVMHVVNRLLEGAREHGAETKVVHLYDLVIAPETGTYSEDPSKADIVHMPADGITALFPEIERADGLVLATPVYWANMSAVMKGFIEHLTSLENDGFLLQGKLASCIAASKEDEGGKEMAAMSLAMPLLQMGACIVPNGVLWYPGTWVNASSSHKDWALEDAPIVGRTMVDMAQLLHEHPIHFGPTR